MRATLYCILPQSSNAHNIYIYIFKVVTKIVLIKDQYIWTFRAIALVCSKLLKKKSFTHFSSKITHINGFITLYVCNIVIVIVHIYTVIVTFYPISLIFFFLLSLTLIKRPFFPYTLLISSMSRKKKRTRRRTRKKTKKTTATNQPPTPPPPPKTKPNKKPKEKPIQNHHQFP